MIKDWLEHAVHGALLGPHLAADGLLIPKVTTIRLRDTACVFFWIGPGRYAFDPSGFINDPSHGIMLCSRASLSKR
jgi:hypothetical protein